MATMQRFNGYEIVDGWAREQIERINNATNAPTDTKYFVIDENGIIALKPEYRGCPADETCPSSISDQGVGVEGSKIHDLPKRIVIPEVVNGVAVMGLSDGMFYHHRAVEEIVLPSTVTVIPTLFCRGTYGLKSIKNTEHIKSIKTKAFMDCRIEEALFPGLEAAEAQTFTQCPYLHIADIGNLVEVPAVMFGNCSKLETVRGGANVATIAQNAFMGTMSLKNVAFLSVANVANIGKNAFFNSRIQFDWAKLTGCTFDTNATPVTDNTTDYWSKIIGNRHYTPCENRLITLLHQMHPLWTNEPLPGPSGKTWGAGCGTFCVIHILSAFTGKKYATPQEFEAEFDFDLEAHTTEKAVALYERLGYSVTSHTGVLTEAAFRDVLDALAAGAYVHISQSTSTNVDAGHAVIAYGVNELGELMIADSAPLANRVGVYNENFTYQISMQNMTGPDSDLIIVRKPAERAN